jgi:hypothetical protein
MKQIWPNYLYSPTTNVLTLTGLNIDRDQLLLVTAADRGRIMYNFADSSVTASAFTSGANTALTLVATTAGLTTTAALVIYYDDQLQTTSISISNLPATQTIIGTVTANAGANFSGEISSGIFNFSENNQIGVYVTDALPTGSNNIGRVTVAGTVTIGAGTAQIGSVTASNINISSLPDGGGNAVIRSFVFGYDYAEDVPVAVAIDNNDQSLLISGTVDAIIGSSIPAGTNRIGVVTIGGGTVTIGAGTAQIGSVTASISNSVVTFYPAQGTTVTNSNFTSTTASTTLVSAVAGREVLTVFNEGAGNLHISPGATCTTIAYQVRLSAGDYWECPNGQLSLAHTAVFATAGTARVTEVS